MGEEEERAGVGERSGFWVSVEAIVNILNLPFGFFLFLRSLACSKQVLLGCIYVCVYGVGVLYIYIYIGGKIN